MIAAKAYLGRRWCPVTFAGSTGTGKTLRNAGEVKALIKIVLGKTRLPQPVPECLPGSANIGNRIEVSAFPRRLSDHHQPMVNMTTKDRMCFLNESGGHAPCADPDFVLIIQEQLTAGIVFRCMQG